MMIDEFNKIKVEISLKDLIDLQETAKLYYYGMSEREMLIKRNNELTKEVEELKKNLEK